MHDATAPTTHDDDADRLLSMVDTTTTPAAPEPEVPLAARKVAEEAARKTYFAARLAGKTSDDAKAEAAASYERALEAQLAPAKPVATTTPAPVTAIVPATTTTRPRIAPAQMDDEGRARSERDRKAAELAGFAPKETVYTRGLRVNETGVENARVSRLEHEAKPLTRTACAELVERIAAEERRDVHVPAAELSMTEGGTLNWNGGSARLSSRAFGSLCSRLGFGGADYLRACPPDLRALNVNRQIQILGEREAEQRAQAKRGERVDPQRITLRTRNGGNAFAVVSPTYAPFDVDHIAAAVAQAAPADARGSVTYDGYRSRIEVMFHSNVQPEDYVAGEFFKAGVLVRTDDSGGGSAVVQSVVWQNLCLNLIVIDQCAVETARIRHVGNVFALAKKFRAAFDKALGNLDAFRRQWGYACNELVLERTRAVADEAVPTSVHDALPGIFNGILERGLVTVPRSVGKRAEVIDRLVDCWEWDASGAKLHGLTRASVVNAFTRLAHDAVASLDDPWAEDAIQRDASALLWGKGGRQPAPLPYVSLEKSASDEATASA